MKVNDAQVQVFLMAFQSLPEETKKEVYQTLKEQLDDTVDFWDTITDQEKNDIKTGLSEIDSGKTNPHSQVLNEAKKWLKK